MDDLPRYRYEMTVKVILAAGGLDEANWMRGQIEQVVRDHTNERVTEVSASLLDLKHRPDLDGSLALREERAQ